MRLTKTAMLVMLTWFACVSFAEGDDDFNTEPDPAPISQPATTPATADPGDTDGFKDELKQVEGDTKPKVPQPEASKRPNLVTPAHHDHVKKIKAGKAKSAKATKDKTGKGKSAKDKVAKKKKDAKAKKKKKTDDDAA